MSRLVYFLSDLHLGADYLPDKKIAERRAADFLLSIKDKASDVYLMGDVLDYWFEYRTVVPRGFVRFFGALAALADAGVKIHWYIGNHDIWLFDYLRNEIGMEVVDGSKIEEINGKRFFLSHGDGLGRLPLGFRFIRAVFRNKPIQKLFSAIHPRWTIPFAHSWSKHSRKYGSDSSNPPFLGLDKEPQAIFAAQYLRDVDPTINFFIFGHRHVLVQENLSPNCQFIILGDWITTFSYAIFDGNAIKIYCCDT